MQRYEIILNWPRKNRNIFKKKWLDISPNIKPLNLKRFLFLEKIQGNPSISIGYIINIMNLLFLQELVE
jgi:hypothetical protein